MKTNIFFSLLIVVTFSSCSRYYIKKGDVYYKTMQYQKASQSYSKAAVQKAPLDVKIKLADSYRLNNDYKNAEKWYSKIVNEKGIDPTALFQYAKLLMNKGEYKEAKKWFNNYLAIKGSDPVASTLVASCDSCNKFYADSARYGLKQVEIPGVATAFASVNYGKGLIFAADNEPRDSKKVSGWTGRTYLDLYASVKNDDGTWTAPEPLKGDINGPFHDGPAVFNQKGDFVYFTRSNYSKSNRLIKNKDDESNLKIFSSELKDGAWTNLKELPFNSDLYSCGHPALSPDEKTLYFISDMPGGFGGTDLYKVTKGMDKDGNEVWSKPENLGNVINTKGNEMFPYIHKNGVLYFSSDSHNSLGGLDIFSATYDGKSWSEPANLNYPINSSKDDFALVLNDDNRTGYISSNRDDLDKIYEVELKELIFIVKGKVTVKGSGEVLPDAVVEIRNNKDNYIQSIPVDDNGNYWMRLKAGINYELVGLMDGYLKPVAMEIKTTEKKRSEVIKADFQLEKIQTEKPIVLENIYYDLDKWEIRKDAAQELDKFAELLKSNPQISIVLNSHTDSRAEDQYNQVLSEKRAKAAVDYLINKGVDPKRLQWRGYGESMLVNNCGNGVNCPEEEHQKNRRTEFQIIKVDQMAQK